MKVLICTILAGTLYWTAVAGEAVGKRPYEMDWAGRTEDHCPPLVDFEDLSGWRTECHDAAASVERTREQQLWGQHVGKLTYRGTGPAPAVRLLPPKPVPVTRAFEAVTLWCYGNNWGWASDPATPRVMLAALFEDGAGHEFSVPFQQVDWKEWSLLHRRLTPDQIQRVAAGASFKGLLITGGRNKEDRVLYFDNLAVFTELFAPLTFEPRARRGIEMLPGEPSGANTGPGQLPFPTSPRTILPLSQSGPITNTLAVQAAADGDGYVFTCQASDGRLSYRLRPQTGTWSDLAVEWQPAGEPGRALRVQPCAGGGVYLQTARGPVPPERAEHLGTSRKGDDVESRWRLSAAGVSVEAIYVYRIWDRSLVIDVLARGGNVGEVRFGRATGPGLEEPRLVTNPFYPAAGGRPAVLVSGPAEAPVFLSGNVDWYLSNASVLWAVNSVAAEGVVFNGGTRYLPLTNGKRNDCFERFFLTFSPRFDEVLPSIPNPPSPWRAITGTHLWRAHGASKREEDARYWTEVHRYGMTRMVVTDHETLWRDEGESFTFRTRAAPGKGGDAGAYEYARLMQDKLGFVYGPYNNFTDFAPVNEFWDFDRVSRDSENQLQRAWMRCYAPKPARAVEFCARLAPQIQEKFHFSTAYCDVHTAVPPWDRVDYDPRVPGAGTLAAVFYAFGEIMLLQKNAWHGPVYSEGNYHCFYMGLTDGNYGQDQHYRLAENPWLVDFDLRRMHDLGCNFGMGNLEMFYANARQPRSTRAERDAEIDRFLAATIAFGHPGFLVMEGGMDNALRSYYLVQQLAARYCLTNVEDIRYVAADGQLLDTSRAVASGAYQRSQVVSRYAGGIMTAANGSRSNRLQTTAWNRPLDLPPNGFAGWTADGSIEVLCGDRNGWRCDYAATPAYLYVDGRDHFARFPRGGGNGIGICRLLPDNQCEIILRPKADCGFAIQAASAVALDQARRELGPARLRSARGLTYVVPVPGAFSYLLTGTTNAPPRPLVCDRAEAFPGEVLSVRGEQAHKLPIPSTAKPGDRLWSEFEGQWIDVTVVALADLGVELDGNHLRVNATSHLPHEADFSVEAGPHRRTLHLRPNQPARLEIDLGAPASEATETLPITLRSDGLAQGARLTIRSVRSLAPVQSLPGWTAGMAFRGKKETGDFGESGAIVEARGIECGGETRTGIFIHPPWRGGVGYAFALYEPIQLAAAQPVAFRAWVGKADGCDPGDGIWYQVVVLDSAGAETVVARANVATYHWQPIEADLSPWASQSIRLKLVTDVGPKDDSGGDWGAWGGMRLETLGPVLHREVVGVSEAQP